MSMPIKVFTLNELKKILPSFKEEYIESTNPKVKEILYNFFFKLGADTRFGIKKQDGFITKNRWGEEDCSTRFVIAERLDDEWVYSPLASNEAKLYTKDQSLINDLSKMSRK